LLSLFLPVRAVFVCVRPLPALGENDMTWPGLFAAGNKGALMIVSKNSSTEIEHK
jgi:hypothetical protein